MKHLSPSHIHHPDELKGLRGLAPPPGTTSFCTAPGQFRAESAVWGLVLEGFLFFTPRMVLSCRQDLESRTDGDGTPGDRAVDSSCLCYELPSARIDSEQPPGDLLNKLLSLSHVLQSGRKWSPGHVVSTRMPVFQHEVTALPTTVPSNHPPSPQLTFTARLLETYTLLQLPGGLVWPLCCTRPPLHLLPL